MTILFPSRNDAILEEALTARIDADVLSNSTILAMALLDILILVPNAIDSNINYATLFLVGGIAQIFWVLPMIKG